MGKNKKKKKKKKNKKTNHVQSLVEQLITTDTPQSIPQQIILDDDILKDPEVLRKRKLRFEQAETKPEEECKKKKRKQNHNTTQKEQQNLRGQGTFLEKAYFRLAGNMRRYWKET